MKPTLLFGFLFCFFATASIAQTRQYSPSLYLGDNTSSDVQIIEDGVGPEIKKATLDLCFGFDIEQSYAHLNVGNFDRVIVPLSISNDSLSGSASSVERKRAIKVALKRKPEKDGVSYSGTISIDGKSYPISEQPVSSRADGYRPEIIIDENPKEFRDVLPNALIIKYKYGTSPQLVATLRQANAALDVAPSFHNRCNDIRSGYEYLKILTPPQESQALVARLRKLPFVTQVGWTDHEKTVTVRVTGQGWVNKGVLNRTTAAAGLSAAMAKALGASVTGTSWDQKTGEVKLSFKRPSKLMPGSGLSELISMVALIAPDRFGDTNRAIVSVAGLSGHVMDDGPGPRVRVLTMQLAAGPGPEGFYIYLNSEEVAPLLKGEWWNGTEWTK